jgi:pimeloyl-ACP methyl ester carboxylesterase
VLTEADLTLSDGRQLHYYDTGGDDRLAVLWHHGTPNLGAPPEPLFATSDQLGLRWISYDRPGYGGSPRAPGRDLASAATYATAVADALGIARFAVMGYSGGGSHAIACGALLPDRVLAVISAGGLAPLVAEDLDWYAGMAPSGVAALTVSTEGRAAKERYAAAGVGYDPEFTDTDFAALAGEWSWLGGVANGSRDQGGGIDDDLAYVAPWRFDLTRLVAPVLLLHGQRDRVVPSTHAEWLARHIPSAELRLRPDDGHVSILTATPAALTWLPSSP